MLKFFLGIVIVAFTTFCGYKLAGKYRKRQDFFRQFFQFNERFLAELGYYRRPLREFLVKYPYKGEFRLFIEEFSHGLNEDNFLIAEIVEDTAFSFLVKEEQRLIENYFSMLGKGDSASQKGYFTSIKEELNSRQIIAENTCKKYADLYIKIGFLCGLFILIIII